MRTRFAIAGTRGRTHALTAAAVVVLAIAHRIGLGAPLFPVDDAYITLHNADALLAGGDPNFAGTAPLVGATSPVHLALTTLLALPFGAAGGLYLAMWVGVLAYATGIVRLAFAWGASSAQALLLVALGLLVALVPHQLLNGLETGLALGGTTWALALASERGHERALAAVCGLLPFLRPELGALALALLALRAWPLVRERRLRDVAAMAGFAAAAAAPWLLWALIATGSPFPSTAGAKIAWFAERDLSGAVKREWVWEEVRQFAGNVDVAAVAALALLASGVGRALIAFAAVLLAFYYAELPGALGHYEQRYLYVLLPGVLLGFAWAFGRSRRWAAVAAVVAAASLVQVAFAWDERWSFHLAGRDFTRVELRGVAEWVNANVPPDSELLVHDAGYISHGTDLRMVDLVGLKTPRLVRFHEELTLPSRGALRGEAIHRIALQEQPDYLVSLRSWDEIFRITGALLDRGWGVEPLRDGAYVVFRLTPPDR